MKRIVISALVFCFLFTTASFAQEGYTTYEFGNHYDATFPETWHVKINDIPSPKGDSPLLEAISPNQSSHLILFEYDRNQKNIDDIILETQKCMPYMVSPLMTLEESNHFTKDYMETRFLLYSGNNTKNEKLYCLIHFAFYEQEYHQIWVVGEYNKLETDRTTIEKICNSIEKF